MRVISLYSVLDGVSSKVTFLFSMVPNPMYVGNMFRLLKQRPTFGFQPRVLFNRFEVEPGHL